MEGENSNINEEQKKVEEGDLSLGNTESEINLHPDALVVENEAPTAPETETKSEEQLMAEKEKEAREKTTLWKTLAVEFLEKIGQKDYKSDMVGKIFRMSVELSQNGERRDLADGEKRALEVLSLLVEKYNKIEQMKREVSDYKDRKEAEKEQVDHDALMGKIGGI